MVDTKEVVLKLTNAERNHKRVRLQQNATAIDKWFKANRKAKTFTAPGVIVNGGKLVEWIPAYCDALLNFLPSLPFALDSLRILSQKALLELWTIINSVPASSYPAARGGLGDPQAGSEHVRQVGGGGRHVSSWTDEVEIDGQRDKMEPPRDLRPGFTHWDYQHATR